MTVNPDVPDSWLVGSENADLDLDNLKVEDFDDLEDTLYIEYKLENLIFSGSCMDVGNKMSPRIYPRGLQLMLGNHFIYHHLNI